MLDSPNLVGAVLVAFVVTVVFMSILRPIAKAIHLVDRPGGRKTHVGDVPIIGGMAMFAGMLAAITLLPGDVFAWPAILVASAILVIVGAIDDRIPVPAAVRLLAQVAVVLLMFYGAGLSLGSIGDPFGTGELRTGGLALLITMLVGLSTINAYNLVDGVDGLAGSLALLPLLAIAEILGYAHPVAQVALAFAAAIVAFLIFNFPTPWNRKVRSFMGDAGSTLLGFTIVWITLGISQGPEPVISPVHCLWFASVPIYDLFTCFFRRMWKGKSPFTPGLDHFHHTLKRGGFGVRNTLIILVALQAVYALIGVLGHKFSVPDAVMFACWSVLGVSQHFIIRLLARRHRAFTISRIAS